MGAALLRDDPVFTAIRAEQKRDRRARKLETRWATFEIGFGTGATYETVEKILAGVVGLVVAVSTRDQLSRDVRILKAGDGTGSLHVVDVNEDGVDLPGTNRTILYEEIVDLMLY